MHERPLADELFLVGHDQDTGKAQVDDAVLDTGLAGAILGELILADRLAIGDDLLVVVDDPRSSGDPVTDTAISEILLQRERFPVRQWVEYLRDHARELVATRLEASGLIQRAQSRGILGRAVRYPAVDPLRASATEARLRFVLERPSELDGVTAALGSLVAATGLEFVLGGLDGRGIRDGLTQMNHLLPPDLRALVIGVESAVARLALRGRR